MYIRALYISTKKLKSFTWYLNPNPGLSRGNTAAISSSFSLGVYVPYSSPNFTVGLDYLEKYTSYQSFA